MGDDEIDAEGYRILMDGIRYKEVQAGTGPQAEYKQALICSYEAQFDDTVFERGVRKMLRVGDGDVPPGFELGLRQLRQGTKCIVRAEWRFAFGDTGRPASEDEQTLEVPPGKDVQWTIECHRLWFKEQDETMSPADALVDARNKKILGNEHFHHENWKKAATNYQDILKTLNPWNYDGDDRLEAEQLYCDCGNNLVFALMKMDEYLKAEKAVCDVLTVAPENRKSLYRATQIALHLSKWPEAHAALKIALENWPNSKDFRDLYDTLREHKAQYKQRKAKMSAKMSGALLSSSGNTPSPPAAASSSSDQPTVEDASSKDDDDEPPRGDRWCLIQ